MQCSSGKVLARITVAKRCAGQRRVPLRRRAKAVSNEVPPSQNIPSGSVAVLDRSEPQKQVLPEYTMAEVGEHNKESDCWVVIEGKVYDITSWVQKHPGGSPITINAGLDVTHLFNSYHMMKVKPMLKRFLIGKVAANEPLISYLNDLDDPFYEDVKQRVDKYFKDNNLHPRFNWSMYIKTAAILTGLAASYMVAHYAAPTLAVSYVAAAFMGVCMALIGTAVQHDANHGAAHPNPRVNFLMGMTIDLVGKSSHNWKLQHVGQHHVYTNVHEYDPDINIEHFMRLSQFQPLKQFHWAQWLYATALYGFMTFKIKYRDDFHQFFTRSLGTKIRTAGFDAKQSVVFWAGKLQYLGWFIVAPLLLSAHSPLTSIGLMLTAEATMAWVLAFMFQLAHVVEGVDMVETEQAKEGGEKVNMTWAESQLATSVDFEWGSTFWTHFSGGLNYQTTHHLFPGVQHTHYPAIAPIIEATAAEYGYKYKKAGNIFKAVGGHFKYLKDMGQPTAASS